jgi:hypothetical protein
MRALARVVAHKDPVTGKAASFALYLKRPMSTWLREFLRRPAPRCVDCGVIAMPGEARCLACCGS